MSFDNTNRGALFRNDKGDNDKRPDYRGNLNVAGDEFELAAWIKTSKKGDKYMSLSVKPKGEYQGTAEPDSGAPFSDDIPF